MSATSAQRADGAVPLPSVPIPPEFATGMQPAAITLGKVRNVPSCRHADVADMVGYRELVASSDIVDWAQAVAEELLSPLGRRWTHVEHVAQRAGELGAVAGKDLPALVAAAYLHDIGYAPALAAARFHPLDGARFVRQHGHERLALLIAHHTGARIEAKLRGFDGYLEEFPFDDCDLVRALTYCDLTTGPNGERMTIRERVAEICDRYGSTHPATRSAQVCLPDFERDGAEIEQGLTALA